MEEELNPEGWSVSISGHEPVRVKFGAILAAMQARIFHRICIAFLASLLCACIPPRSTQNEVPPVPVAVWTYQDLAGSSTERSTFFRFEEQHHVREVYLEA